MKRKSLLLILFLSIFTVLGIAYAIYNTSSNNLNVFKTDKYNIIIDTQGGTISDTSLEVKNNSVIMPSISRRGYTFLGYTTIKNGTVDIKGVEEIKKINNKTIYAKWKANTFIDTVSCEAWGLKNKEGNNKSKNAFYFGEKKYNVDYDSSFTLDLSKGCSIPKGFKLPNGEKAEGDSRLKYNFHTESYPISPDKNWVYKTFPYTFVQSDNDIYVEYNYIPITYTVTYNLNGGTNNSANPKTYNILYGFSLTNPTKRGYTFAGWTDASGKKVTGINENAKNNFTTTEDFNSNLNQRTIGNQTLTANWIPNSVTVTFNGNCGTITKNGTQTFTSGNGQRFADTGAFRNGYTLLGWSDSPTAIQQSYTILSGVTDSWIGNGGTRTIYATWKINSYNLTVNPNGGKWNNTTNSSKFSMKFNDTKAISNPTRDNSSAGSYAVSFNGNGVTNPATINAARTNSYTFKNWTVAGAGSTLTNTTFKMGYADATLTANWNQTTTTSAITLPTVTRDNYTFLGWYDAATGGNKIGDAGAKYTPNKAITLYANWVLDNIVTFDSMTNGTIRDNEKQRTVLKGNKLGTLPIPTTQTDYVFDGWYENLYKPNVTTYSCYHCSYSFSGEEVSMTATGVDAYIGEAYLGNYGQPTYTAGDGDLIEIDATKSVSYYLTNSAFDKNYFTFWDSNKKAIKIGDNYFVTNGDARLGGAKNYGTFAPPSNAKYMTFRLGVGNSVSGTTYKTKVLIKRGSANSDTKWVSYYTKATANDIITSDTEYFARYNKKTTMKFSAYPDADSSKLPFYTYDSSTGIYTVLQKGGTSGWGLGALIADTGIKVPFNKTYVLHFEIKVPEKINMRIDPNLYFDNNKFIIIKNHDGDELSSNDLSDAYDATYSGFFDNVSVKAGQASFLTLSPNSWHIIELLTSNNSNYNTDKVDLLSQSGWGLDLSNHANNLTYWIQNPYSYIK